MSEMVERVARAICREAAEDSGVVIGDMDRHVDGGWKDWIAEARAAIEAMREPNQEMMNSGRIYILEGRLGEGEAEEVWRAMIDQALNGSKTPSE